MTPATSALDRRDEIAARYTRNFNRLLHLVSLSRTGKSTAALDALVPVAIHLESGDHPTVSAQQVAEALTVYFGSPHTTAEVQACLDAQSRASVVRRHPGGGYSLPPATAARVQQRIRDSQTLEEEVRDEWLSQLREDDLCLDVPDEHVWACLKKYSTQVFLRHGALSAEVLDPELRSQDSDADLDTLMEEAIAEVGVETNRDEVTLAITRFFRTKTPARSKYLAELLDSTFTFFSLQSKHASTAYVGDLQPLSLFLDSNFIFSLVGADVDNSQELAKELVKFIQENDLPCTLYYHEATLKEVQKTLDAVGRHLCGKRWPSSVSAAAVEARTGSGITLKYHSLNAERPISPRAFMDRFSDIPTLLNELGVTIYRSSSSVENDLEMISTLIDDYGSFVRRYRSDDKAYDVLDHDVRLGLTVSAKRRRVGAGETALDAGAFFVTNDRLFRRFADRHMASGRVPIAVLPEQLLQVLRPLAPSDIDWDARFIEAFAVPEFRSAASDYTETSTRLLEYLALYGDLPKQAAVSLLTNQLLLDELSAAATDEEFEAAVENSLAEELASLAEENSALTTQLRELKARLENASARAESERAERESLATRVGTLEDQAARVRSQRDDDLATVEAERDELRMGLEALVRKTKAGHTAIVCALAVAGVLGLPVLADWDVLLEHENRVGIQMAAGAGFALLATSLVWRDRFWALFGMAVAALLTIAPML
jgi:regulator of replication initiation timing